MAMPPEMGLTQDERRFRGFAAKTGMTAAGIAYAEIATDPFHDDAVKDLKGYPDMNSMNSVVMCLPQSMTVTKPGALGAGNWSAHIVMSPMPESRSYSLGGGSTGGICYDNVFRCQTSDATYTLGGVQCFAALTNTGQVDPYSDIVAGSMSCPPEDLSGIVRVIGAAIEIIDSTAQLYKQGVVYAYCLPNSQMDPETYYFQQSTGSPPSITGYGVGSFQSLTRYVTNTADIEKLRGTLSWESKEGVYIVQRPNDIKNVAEQPSQVHPIFALFDKSNNTPYTGGYIMPTASVVPDDSASLSIHPQVLPPFHTMGAYFSGLSDQASLTIKWRLIIERMPVSGALQLVATPTPGFDPLVMETISQVFGQLPVAVPVSENPEGEWFSRVVSAVKDITDWGGPMAMAIPGPQAKAVGGLASAISAAAGSYLAQHPADNVAPVAGSAQPAGLPQLGSKKKNPPRKKKGPKGPPPLPKRLTTNGYGANVPNSRQKRRKNKKRVKKI